MRSPTLFLALAVPAPSLLRAQDCHDLTPLDTIAQEAVQALRLRGMSLRVDQNGTNRHEKVYGSYTLSQVVPIASASKWLSAAVLMSVVDEGKLRLDDPVSKFIPSFTGAKAGITLRQCFSHSSGLPASDDSISDDTITLRQAADKIAALPLDYTPGTAFAYGGVSMHVAGAVCEVATGKLWAKLFEERIAVPLGMTSTDYNGFGVTPNPRIAGGARSSLRDYARFADMLRAGGVFDSKRVLSAASIAEMFRNQVKGLRVIHTPHPHGAPYGIGTWLDRLDAQERPLLVSGAGAFGFTAWVDLERGTSSTLLVLDRYAAIWPYVDRLQGELALALKPFGVACAGQSTASCRGPIWMNASAPPRAESPDFRLLGWQAPPQTAGVLLLGQEPDPVGWTILGARLYVPLAPPPIVLVVATDGLGATATPLPLLGIPPSTRFGAQYAWLNTASCGGLGTLSASHALDVTVLAR